MNILLSIGFATNALLGNLCMAPMAFAEGMEMSHQQHMEIAMTPMVPMSSLPCDHCITVLPEDIQAQDPIGCTSHCISQANETRVGNVIAQTMHASTSAPLTVNVVLEPNARLFVALPTTAPPIATHINTTILML